MMKRLKLPRMLERIQRCESCKIELVRPPLEYAETPFCTRCLAVRIKKAEARCEQLEAALNTPEVEDFDKAIPLEAAHQVERWGAAHDSGKSPADWFWLVGYLAGKALCAHISGNTDKAKHHCISTAAVLRNWHAAIRNGWSLMRPGISEEKTAAIDAALAASTPPPTALSEPSFHLFTTRPPERICTICGKDRAGHLVAKTL